MDRKYFVKIKNVVRMKKLVYSFGFAVVFGVAAFGLLSCKDNSCHGQGMLECENSGTCCERRLPYNDGAGTCYSSLSYCRQSGYACATCW
jgi:hypothetical protein